MLPGYNSQPPLRSTSLSPLPKDYDKLRNIATTCEPLWAAYAYVLVVAGDMFFGCKSRSVRSQDAQLQVTVAHSSDENVHLELHVAAPGVIHPCDASFFFTNIQSRLKYPNVNDSCQTVTALSKLKPSNQRICISSSRTPALERKGR